MVTDAPRSTARLPMSEIVSELNDTLGATLVAYVSGATDRKLPYKWAAGLVVPRDQAQVKLMAAHRIMSTIAASEGEEIARQWFIGMNPRLSYISPAQRIRDGDAAIVQVAAEAFADGTDG